MSIETEINKYPRVLREERLSEPERIETQDSSSVSITPQPAHFTASAKREIQENQLEIISDDIFSELVSRGYIREVRSLLVNEEKINELREMERSVLFDQGIINVELQCKTARPDRDDIDDAFIQEMLDAGVFGLQLFCSARLLPSFIR